MVLHLEGGLKQGTLVERESLVRLTSKFRSAALDILKILSYFFFKTSYLDEEASCTAAFLSLTDPWLGVGSCLKHNLVVGRFLPVVDTRSQWLILFNIFFLNLSNLPQIF